MDEMTPNSKPLRKTANKIKDIMDTYLKNDNMKNIPITDNEITANNQTNEIVSPIEDNVATEEINNKDYENLIDDYKIAVDTLNKNIEDVTKERDDLKEQLIRKAAELENIRRRSLKEKQEMIDYANERLLFKMLELLDDINNAYNASLNSKDFDALFKGVELIKNKAFKMFEESGVKPMESSVGKEFNVDYHEAMMRMPSDLPENYVVQEFQNGYMLNEKVLRHARVITSAGSN